MRVSYSPLASGAPRGNHPQGSASAAPRTSHIALSHRPCIRSSKSSESEPHRRLQAQLLPQGGGLPVGVPRAYRCAGVHPNDRPGPVHRGLHAQPGFQRLPRNPRAHLRPAVRAGVPPRPRRGEAGGHLPAQARRRRQQGRVPPSPSRNSEGEKRQARRVDRRRPREPDGGE